LRETNSSVSIAIRYLKKQSFQVNQGEMSRQNKSNEEIHLPIIASQNKNNRTSILRIPPFDSQLSSEDENPVLPSNILSKLPKQTK